MNYQIATEETMGMGQVDSIKELWKDISGYEGKYLVSNLGRVKSLPNVHWRSGRIMKGRVNADGYMCIGLYKGIHQKHVNVHRLVAGAFVCNPCDKHEVNHIDGHKCNNNVNNLEWCTRIENSMHSHATGLVKHKLAHIDVDMIRMLEGSLSSCELGILYNVSDRYIRKIHAYEVMNCNEWSIFI